MKILILKPSSLGDVIHALPVLRLLKLHYPHSKIFWWIDSALAPLLDGDPDLAGVIRFERKRWSKPRFWPEMVRSVLHLRAQEFDLVIDLQCLARSGAFAWLARGKFLIGLDEVREGARGFYDLAAPRKEYLTHAVDWYLAVLPLLGVPVHKQFHWLPARKEVSDALEKKWFGADSKFQTQNAKLILLQPGARWVNKRWPAEHFSELVRLWAKKFPGTRFAVLGGKEDLALAEKISATAPENILNLCGETSLPEMIEWVRRGDLLVTNDTGPMHVAAALGKPLVALFGPTEPRRTGPYGQLQNVLRLALPCAPCMKPHCVNIQTNECLRALPPVMVLDRACKIIA